jgi:DNA-binding FrmR family transcriptional regulator
MGHLTHDKGRLRHRVRRMRGQLEAVERAIEAGETCGKILMTLAACRGAMGALLSEIVEGHVREHVVPATGKARLRAAEELIAAVRSYVR